MEVLYLKSLCLSACFLRKSSVGGGFSFPLRRVLADKIFKISELRIVSHWLGMECALEVCGRDMKKKLFNFICNFCFIKYK